MERLEICGTLWRGVEAHLPTLGRYGRYKSLQTSISISYIIIPWSLWRLLYTLYSATTNVLSPRTTPSSASSHLISSHALNFSFIAHTYGKLAQNHINIYTYLGQPTKARSRFSSEKRDDEMMYRTPPVPPNPVLSSMGICIPNAVSKKRNQHFEYRIIANLSFVS